MLYNIAFFIFSLFYLPILICKGKLHRDFLERFGLFGREKAAQLKQTKPTIWIQAVSVGEVNVCKSLIELLRKRFQGHKIVVSTITKTGNDLAKKIFPADTVVIYFPLDFSFIVKNVISLIRPSCYIMVETEIWPNVLGECYRRKIPTLIINGRISDRSFGKYLMVKRFLAPTLKKITRCAMQSETDKERIIELGADPERVQVVGNMKFDIIMKKEPLPPERMREMLLLRPDEKLLVAGSTHAGEETIVLESYSSLVRDFPFLRLLIAPRHIERTNDVENVIRKAGFTPLRFSQINKVSGDEERSDKAVIILDTIGQLADIYAISTAVFIGGSLIAHGGQNPIEPAIFEKPILFGPHMFNFKEITNLFLKNGAAIQITVGNELSDRIRELLNDPEKADALGKNAKRAVLQSRGATEKNSDLIAALLAA